MNRPTAPPPDPGPTSRRRRSARSGANGTTAPRPSEPGPGDTRADHPAPRRLVLLRLVPGGEGHHVRHPAQRITALIGPSGCGKSTLLRTINRMNDLIPGPASRARSCTTARTCTRPASTRSRSGGASGWSSRSRTRSRSRSTTTSPSGRGSTATRATWTSSSRRASAAALWDEVKDKLKQSGSRCPADSSSACASPARSPSARRHPHGRALLGARPAVDAADRGAHGRAPTSSTRSSSSPTTCSRPRGPRTTVFLNMAEDRAGYIVEQGPTLEIFTNPKNQLTEDYVSGRFG